MVNEVMTMNVTVMTMNVTIQVVFAIQRRGKNIGPVGIPTFMG